MIDQGRPLGLVVAAVALLCFGCMPGGGGDGDGAGGGALSVDGGIAGQGGAGGQAGYSGGTRPSGKLFIKTVLR